MSSFVLFLFFTGIILIVTNELTYNKPREIQYRYLPRDLDQFIRTEEFPSAIFGSMWGDPDTRRGGDGGPQSQMSDIRQSN